MDVVIKPLTPEVWPQLAALFEEASLTRWCWCMYWRRRGLDWSNADREGNRAALEELAGHEVAPGLVALDADGRAIGWVSLAPRQEFDRLARSRSRPPLDDVPVWTIVCFVVSRHGRRQGLTRRLLDAAIAYAREHGAPAIEAYPAENRTRRLVSSALYTGSLSTFLRAGFRVVQPVVVAGSTVDRSIVRLELR